MASLDKAALGPLVQFIGVGGTTLAFVTDQAAAAGTRIALFCWFYNAPSDPTITVSGGLTWVTLMSMRQATSYGMQILLADAPSGLASGSTLTATWSVATDERYILGSSFSGVTGLTGTPNSNIIDPSATGAWNGGPTTPVDDAVILGMANTNFGSQAGATPDAGYTNLDFEGVASAGISLHTVYKLDGVGGNAYTAGGTFTGATAGSSIGITAAISAGAPQPGKVDRHDWSKFPKEPLRS